MKRGMMFSIVLLFLFSLSLVSALPDTSIHTISTEDNNYTIELVSETNFRVTNSSGFSDSKFLTLLSIKRIVDLYFYQTYSKLSPVWEYMNSTTSIGVRENLSIGGPNQKLSTNISFDGEEYEISFPVGFDYGSTIRVTDSFGNSNLKTVSEGQTFGSGEDIQGLHIQVINADESAIESIGIKTELIIYKEMNFFFGQPDECSFIGEVACVQSNSYQTCGDDGYNPYVWVWGNETFCEPSLTCFDGLCVNQSIICEDECEPYNERECTEGNNYQRCGNYDSDSCWEWREISCQYDKVCIDGTCTTKPPEPPPEPPTPENQCNNIGLRESGKYCSSSNVWITQKNVNRICENDFECNSNICTSGSCQSRTIPPGPNNLWYWIGGIVVVLFFIVGIVLMIKSKR